MRLRGSRLNELDTDRLLVQFVAGTAARRAASLAGVNRNTATLFYHRLRKLIAHRLERSAAIPDRVALDERLHAPQGDAPNLADLVPVFGLAGRAGKVYAVALARGRNHAPAGSRAAALLDAIVYTRESARVVAFDVAQMRVSATLRAGAPDDPRRAEIAALHEFWRRSQRHLRRYRGIAHRHLELFLKECEWRFNHGPNDRLLQLLRLWVATERRRPLRGRRNGSGE